MNWTNKITSFNLEGKRVTRPDNTLVCVCEKAEDAKLISAAPELLKALKDYINYGSSTNVQEAALNAINKAIS